MTDEAGSIVGQMHFDPWGSRLDAQDWDGVEQQADIDGLRSITHRGFTGHEQLDAVGLIHMNGRIYDPNLGRMLSADPINSEPMNLQRYNRYSYVNNRPLSFTDPSGFDGDPLESMPIYWRCNSDSCWGADDSTELPRTTVRSSGRSGGCSDSVSGHCTTITPGQFSSVWDQLQFRNRRHVGRGEVPDEDSKEEDDTVQLERIQVQGSAAERAALMARDVAGYWALRRLVGDPWSQTGLAIWNSDHPSVTLLDRAMVALTMAMLESAIEEHGTTEMAANMDQTIQNIGVDLARAHYQETLVYGTQVPLSVGASYHHQVFGRYGLPPSAYGGTLFNDPTGLTYAAQAQFVNRIIEYCRGCRP